MPNKLYTFLSRSSSGEPYQVEVAVFDSEKISMHCSCKAGLLKQWCKHKADIIDGFGLLLIDESQLGIFEEVCGLIENSQLSNEYLQYKSELEIIEETKIRLLNEIESEAKAAKKEAKLKFARQLAEGI